MRQADERCLQSSIQALTEKQGKEFDIAYIGMQVGAHQKMKDHLAVYQQHVSQEWAQKLAQAEPKVEQHLQKAKQIWEQLTGNASGGQSARVSQRQQ